MEKTVYSLTLGTTRFKVTNSEFCLHSLFKRFVWIPEYQLFLHTTSTDRFYNRGGMRLLRGTSCICKYKVITNDCRGFNNLSYTVHLKQEYVVAPMDQEILEVFFYDVRCAVVMHFSAWN